MGTARPRKHNSGAEPAYFEGWRIAACGDVQDPATGDLAAVALGSVEIAARYLDGRTETVQVRILKIIAYPRFFSLLTDEPRLAELLCDKPTGWADTLLPDSLMDVVEKGTELNFSPARRWSERRTTLDAAVGPTLQETPSVTSSRTSV